MFYSHTSGCHTLKAGSGLAKIKDFHVGGDRNGSVLKLFIALCSMQLNTSDLTFWLIDVLRYTCYSANYLSAIKNLKSTINHLKKKNRTTKTTYPDDFVCWNKCVYESCNNQLRRVFQFDQMKKDF